MASEHWPTYVLLSFYVLLMIIVTIIANVKNRKEKAQLIELQDKSDYSMNSSAVSTHFLAGKNFGAFILLLTTFASVFSGYTVVGVPTEAGIAGFVAIRWLAGILSVGASMLMIFPRIRRLSIIRNYESPGDFINDRYQSKLLCVLVTLCLCVPQLLYLAIQLYSLGAVLSNLTDGELSFYAIVIVSTLMILIFEAFGGMRSVAYTDAVQATVMVLIFIAIPIVIGVQYGGFVGQVTNSDNLPCSNSNIDGTSGCLNYEDAGVADEFYLRSPSALTIVNYILFSISLASFSLNPHVIQRAFAAEHDWQVKFVMICMFMAGFLAMIPGILTGITYISNKNELKPEYQSFPAFQAMLAVFRDEGGFVAFISYIALLAGIAGIMSTADSALIGVSNTVSCDIFKNWLLPHTEPNKIVLIGKVISFITMAISIGIAIYLYETGIEYGVILTLQQAILWQAFPAYLFGLYTKISTKSVLIGLVFGLICDIILISIVFSGNDPFEQHDPSLAGLDKSWSSLVGVALNLIACGISHCFVCSRDEYNGGGGDAEGVNSDDIDISDGDDNNHLSPQKISKIMKGIQEPLTKYYGIFVWLTVIFMLITAFHWIGEIDPELIEEYGIDTVKTFLYNGTIQSVIAGLPSWTFASMMWYVVACLSGMYAASLWTVGRRYEDKQHVPANSSQISLPNVNIKYKDDHDDDGNIITATEI